MDGHRRISRSRIWMDEAADLTDADMDLLNIHSFVVSISVAHGQNRYVLHWCVISVTQLDGVATNMLIYVGVCNNICRGV